jgi:MarR family transcriptional regulator, organic hydroperoxide resistance regulator
MRLLWAVDHGLRSLSKRMHANLGLTGPQRLALRMIGTFPGLSLSELAELLHVDRGTLTGILERLVTRGFVLRRLDPTDGRRSMLRLSDKGRRLNKATSGTIESKVQRALASVPAAKVAASKSVLEALAAELVPEKTRTSRATSELRDPRRRAQGRIPS